jgi:hypothetical protein
MKKSLVALATFLMIGAAMADSVSVEYQAQDVKGSQDNKYYGMKYTKSLGNNLTADVGTQTTVGLTDSKTTNRTEVGITPIFDVRGLKLTTRFATGEKSTLNNRFAYYSIQPGVSVPVTDKLDLNTAWRYRTAYHSGKNDETRTTSVGASYKVTSVDAVGIRFDRVRGDANQNNVAVNYIRSF